MCSSDLVLEMQGRPVAILLTHGHFDHILAAEEIKKKYNIPIYACAKEEKTLQDPRINLTAFHMSSYTLKADVYLTDLQVVELAGFSVQMIETPGHTLGSCCYYLKDEGVLFSGDTVFCGSVGRTDFPEGHGAFSYFVVAEIIDRKSTRLNSSHANESRMPSSA